jgi:alkylmercury lyase
VIAFSTVEELADRFLSVFPKLDVEGQRIALETYRALGTGSAANVELIASAAGTAPSMTREVLRSFPGVYWEDGQIVGFWGLSPRPVSQHRLHVGDRTLYAWCAWDTLFLPELLGVTAHVESRVNGTDQTVRMTVSKDGVGGIDPPGTVLSMLRPREDMLADIVKSLCHFIFFFPSEAGAQAWLQGRPDAFLMTVEDGFRLGQMKNRGHFPACL